MATTIYPQQAVSNNLTSIQPLSTIIAGPTGSATGWVRLPHPKRLSKFADAMFKARTLSGSVAAEVEPYYRRADIGSIIPSLGALNPVRNGKPQVWVNIFLNAGTPMNPRSKTASMWTHAAFFAGLFYRIPPVPMRNRTKYRLTIAGLALLDHWAVKFPKFKPFVDAYISMKDRKAIASDCFVFTCGTIPKRVKDMIDLAEVYQPKAEEKRRQLEARRFQEEMIRRQNYLANSGGYIYGNITSGGLVGQAPHPLQGIGSAQQTLTNAGGLFGGIQWKT